MSTLNGQEDALQLLIAAKKWKEALNICDKKLKKAKDNDYLLVQKIAILLHWPDNARQEQAVKELDALVERIPPLTNIDALKELDKLAKYQEPKVQQIWIRAAENRPQDEQLHRVWYRSKFETGHLESAQKATVLWRNHFPSQRTPFFLHILVTYLISEDPKYETKKGLSQGQLKDLAYNILRKAAAGIEPEGKTTPTRAINTLEDFLLLSRVYRAQGKYQEACSVTQLIGDAGCIDDGKDNWEFVRQIIELSELAQNWTTLWILCDGILGGASKSTLEPSGPAVSWGKLGDDWRVWDGYVEASCKIGTPEILQRTEYTILHHEQFKSRNASLALLKFYVGEIASGRKTRDALLSACWEYFHGYSTKASCFQDLKRYLPSLDHHNHEKLLAMIAEDAAERRPTMESSDAQRTRWITSEINALKLDYYLVVSREDDTMPEQLLTAFISNCLRLYKASLQFGLGLPVSDRRPGDDAALLAAMGLIHLHRRSHLDLPSQNGNALLRSIVVLEYLLLQSKHNYDALLILVRLYMFLGAGSLAMDCYARLSIKNLQHATISWVLFTQISTIHPHPIRAWSGDGKNEVYIDPLEEMNQILQWYKTADGLTVKSIHMMQENGQWNMSLDALSTRNFLSTSFTKYRLIVESRRIRRLRRSSQDVQNHQTRIPHRTSDTRDRAAFPSFEAHCQPIFEEILPIAGPKTPNDTWLVQRLDVEQFWEVMHNNGKSSIGHGDLRPIEESSASEQIQTHTDQEIGVSHIIDLLMHLHRVFSDTSEYHARALDNLVRTIVTALEDTIKSTAFELAPSIEKKKYPPFLLTKDLSIPTWSTFHKAYMALEICQFTVPLLTTILAENRKKESIDNKWLERKVRNIQEDCKEIAGNVHQSATNLREGLRKPAALHEFEQAVLARSSEGNPEDVVGKELLALGDRADVARICLNLTESWIEGLDGVLKTKAA